MYESQFSVVRSTKKTLNLQRRHMFTRCKEVQCILKLCRNGSSIFFQSPMPVVNGHNFIFITLRIPVNDVRLIFPSDSTNNKFEYSHRQH
mmetsp:Transcript_11253/g.27035  ORF Transcript_11253/g.27035 Transcript_11253/m.27035 type:complete len:90 (-) Transcript_11253:318-587(-)